MNFNTFILMSVLFNLSGCFFKPDEVTISGDKKAVEGATTVTPAKINISSFSIINNQLIITGTDLAGATSVRITGASGFDETFQIESQSASELIANGLKSITFAMGEVFSLIISDVHGAATFPITFSLQDGAITASKLADMGAGIGQILKYNGSSWVAGDLASLTFAGNWNGNSNTPDLLVTGMVGEYYIVNTAGVTDLLGGPGTNSWGVGDWVVWNEGDHRWEKVDNAANVTGFNGRNGPVMPLANDYTWAQIDKTISSLGDIADVDTSGITTDKILKWDGAKWIIADHSAIINPDTITNVEITDGTISDADLAGNIAQTKIVNLATDLAAKLPLAGGTMSGNIDFSGAQTVDGVDVSALKTQSDNNISVVTGKAPVPVANCDGALEKLQWNGTAFACGTDNNDNTNAGTICAVGKYLDGDGSCVTLDAAAVALGNVSNVAQVPLSYLDTDINLAANSDTKIVSQKALKAYVAASAAGNSGDFKKDGTIVMTGNLDFGNNKAKFKSDNANYVEMMAPGSLAATYTLVYPADAGASGEFLVTNGAGVLSWVTPSSGVGTSSGDALDVAAVPNCPANQKLQMSAGPTYTLSCVSDNDTNTDAGSRCNAGEYLDGNDSCVTLNAAAVGLASVSNIAQLPLAGGTMTGNIVFAAAQTVDGVDVSALKTQSDNNITAVSVKATKPGASCNGASEKMQWNGTAFACGSDNNDNTNAGTICAVGEYLDGDGSCIILNAAAIALGNVSNVAQMPLSYLDTDVNLAANSDTKVASQKAIRAYVDANAAGIGDFKKDGTIAMTGNFDFGNNKAKFKSDNTNYVEMMAPSSLAATYTLTYPVDAGASGEFLATNGAGVLSWVAPNSGVGTSSGDALDVAAVPNCLSSQKLQMSAGPTYTLSCVSDNDTNTDAGSRCNAGEYLDGNDSCVTLNAAVVGLGNVTNVAQLPLAGGTMTGNIVFSAAQTVDGVDVSALKTQSDNNVTAVAAKATKPGASCNGASEKLQWNGTAFACGSDNNDNSNAGTICVAGEYLDGDGSCVALNAAAVALGNVSNLAQMPLNYLDTDINLAANSDTKVPSQKAFKAYVDATVAAGGGDFKKDGTIAMTGNLDFGSNKAKFKSDNANYVEMLAPSSLAATYTLIYPADDGTSGQILSTNGSGVLSWITAGVDVGTASGDALDVAAVPNCSVSQKLQMSAGPTYTLSCVSDNDTNADAGSRCSAGEYLDGNDSCVTLNVAAVGLGNVTNTAQLPLANRDNGALSTSTTNVATSGAVKTYVDGLVAAAGTVTSIVAGTGLTGGTITASGTINVDVGTTANKIVQLDGSGNLPALDASNLTGMVATNIQVADSVDTCDGSKVGKMKSANTFLYFCNGTAWKLVVLNDPPTTLSISPSSQSGMDITGGSSPGSVYAFTISNDGATVSATITVSLSSGTNFEVTADTCSTNTLGVGANCSVSVRSKTSTNGAMSTNLVITADNNPQAALTGTASGFLEVCGGAGDNCYDDASAISGALAITPLGKNIEYVFANGTSGFKIWKEVSGNRILKATGLDEWQKKLNTDGKSFSAVEDFSAQLSQIGGRTCPDKVYQSDADKFNTTSCLYYDTGNSAQRLDIDGTDGILGMTDWSNYNGALSKWFVGNIKTCGDKGMRLPTVYETTSDDYVNGAQYFPPSDGTPGSAIAGVGYDPLKGVPSYGGLTWTATSIDEYTTDYRMWDGASDYGGFYGSLRLVRCVIP